MEQSQLDKLESLIKHHATSEAVGYYLKHAINGRYPNAGFFMLDPFEGPEAAPSGQYQVFFTRTLSTDTPALPAHGPNPIVHISGPVDSASAKSQQKEKESSQLATKTAQKATWTDDPAYTKMRLELEAERHSHEMQENRLLIGKKVRLASENAEYIVLLRAMRHELEQSYQMQQESQRQNVNLVGDLMARFVELAGPKGAPLQQAQQQGSSWLTPEMLTLGTSLLKSLLGKEDVDAVNATILEKLAKTRDEVKKKVHSLEKGKKGKKVSAPKKPASKKTKAKRAAKVKGQLTKGEQP